MQKTIRSPARATRRDEQSHEKPAMTNTSNSPRNARNFVSDGTARTARLYRRIKHAVALAVLSVSAICLASAQSALNSARTSQPLGWLISPQPVTQPGQSATLLPDGRWLVLGGAGPDKPATSAAGITAGGGSPVAQLGVKMARERGGHTATLLPSGNVLVLGGVDSTGEVVGTVEQFDPATNRFEVIESSGLMARHGHSATVLADGKILVAGGYDERGEPVTQAELYDPISGKSEQFSAKLQAARAHHLAALLPGADVLLWGGVGSSKEPVPGGEVYKSESQAFDVVGASQGEQIINGLTPVGTPAVASSQPAEDASAAPVNGPLVVRFTQRMRVTTLDTRTVTLIGPHGAVPIKPVPVEHGLLLFVNPAQDLLPASRYTLFIKGASNVTGQTLPFTAIGFTTGQLGSTPAPAPATGQPANGAQSNQGAVATSRATSALASSAPAITTLPAEAQRALVAAAAINEAEIWSPDARNMKGDWRAQRTPSPVAALPPLAASPGETALAGQVLTLNGRALGNVTLSIGSESTRTDPTGRFLLANLQPGDHILAIDGETARTSAGTYGVYQVRVRIEEKVTNVLPYTIWSPMLDPAGTRTITSPAAQEVVLTSPKIPGLELRLPAGTVIRDRSGRIVTSLNMTAIPTDRPPFPLPNTGVPVYFTIQPGGAQLANISAQGKQGARLIYPNFSAAAAGTRMDFWNYDVQGKGWYVYGQGTVSKDGRQVVPDQGVVIYEFSGAMISLPTGAPPEGPPPGGCNGKCGDPVDSFTGLFVHERTDLAIKDVLPIEITRTYRQRDLLSRAFGIGTSLSYDMFLVGDTSPWTYQDLILPDGGRIHYKRTSAGTSYSNAVYAHTSTSTHYYGSILRYRGGTCYWELTFKTGEVICFPESYLSANPRVAAPVWMTDSAGNTISFARDSSGNLTRITSPSGRYVELAYDTRNRITRAVDNIGRTVSYEYDAGGRLATAIDALGRFEKYTYDASNNMLTVRDRRGNLMVANEYDANNRVSKQTYADGTTNLFAYRVNAANQVTQMDVTDERGIVTRRSFNSSGYITSMARAFGLPEQQTETFVFSDNNLLLLETDFGGRQTSYTYDAMGNVISRTRLADTKERVTETMTYTAGRNKLASIADPLGNTWSIDYDAQGNPVKFVDPNGNHADRRYNGSGLLAQVVDGLGNGTTFDYQGFDLAQVTDPLGRTLGLFTDSAGRMRSRKDPLGNSRRYDLDALDRLTGTTDPLQQAIATGFDENGNPTSVTDPKGNSYKFEFDARNTVVRSIDPLEQAESYVYDASHNLIQKIDRKGQVTRFAYDVLGRLQKTTFADGSTIGIIYDRAGRPVRYSDSVNGAVTLAYDNFDRVTQVSTPKGSVAYTYYANGLRKSMNAASQPPVTYAYDPGNRLTRIEQAAGPANNNQVQAISFTYDAADRLVQTVYPNGVTRTNTYDAAGQITLIEYKKANGSLLGDLGYTYDAAGRRTGVTRSLARTALPAAMSSATVDASNRLTEVEGRLLAYDANGNLVRDGGRAYVWNARDQLVQINDSNGNAVATFTYDALGRRQTKSVNGISSGFVYDGLNVIQELNDETGNNSSAANVRAIYLTGGIDETFTQLSQTGSDIKSLTYLTDALGSTVGLVDSSGARMVDYTYDPYGATNADGVAPNPFQFSGRENDGELYYYRARYYSPALRRFLSSDPIGLFGGINTYLYVDANPISKVDPLGLQAWPGETTSRPGYLPGPGDVFAPGTPTNDAFVDSINTILDALQLPKSGACKASEWDYCYAKCGGPSKTKGCYVSIRWKTRRIRPGTGGAIREEERIVNCNCAC
jgi:RHS repeat-associated protein